MMFIISQSRIRAVIRSIRLRTALGQTTKTSVSTTATKKKKEHVGGGRILAELRDIPNFIESSPFLLSEQKHKLNKGVHCNAEGPEHNGVKR